MNHKLYKYVKCYNYKMKQKHITKAINELGKIALLWISKFVIMIMMVMTIMTEHSILTALLLFIIMIFNIMIILYIVSFIGIVRRGNIK